MILRWYVLRSKPNKEDALHQQATSRGLETYFPCLDAKPVNPRARNWKPYFPGYLFVRANLVTLGISAIQYMPYSAGLVEFGGTPAIIPDEVIQSLQKNLEILFNTSKKNNAGEKSLFVPGTVLTINNGPFAGYEAIFDTSLPSNDRIRILLQAIKGKQIAVELPMAYVEKKEHGSSAD